MKITPKSPSRQFVFLKFPLGVELAGSPFPLTTLVATVVQTVSLNSIRLSKYNPGVSASSDINYLTAQIHLNLSIKIRRLKSNINYI
jgi:hypothetical protein